MALRLGCDVRQAGVIPLAAGLAVTQAALGACSLDDCALTVMATVVSKHPGRIILDCGSKTLAADGAGWPAASAFRRSLSRNATSAS